MQHKIILTHTAKKDLDAILNYIEQNWSISYRKNFIYNLNELITLISQLPFIYEESQSYPGVRRCIISKQNSMYYKVVEDKIIILTIHDNRKNPNLLDNKLKHH